MIASPPNVGAPVHPIPVQVIGTSSRSALSPLKSASRFRAEYSIKPFLRDTLLPENHCLEFERADFFGRSLGLRLVVERPSAHACAFAFCGFELLRECSQTCVAQFGMGIARV